MIYLFAGKRRQSDIGSILQRVADSGSIRLSLVEFDIERSPDHDLTSEHLWTHISDLLKEGYILVVSPPCNTFSRARFQWLRHPGPRPLRNGQLAQRVSLAQCQETSRSWRKQTVSYFVVLKRAFSVTLPVANSFGSIRKMWGRSRESTRPLSGNGPS